MKIKKTLFGLFLVGAVFSAIVFNNTKNVSTEEKTTKTSINLEASLEDKVFTIEELAKFDGRNGNLAYIAVDGTVYDVTNMNSWKGGLHKENISAGRDLSKEINKSPHGKSVLKKLSIVGRLQ